MPEPQATNRLPTSRAPLLSSTTTCSFLYYLTTTVVHNQIYHFSIILVYNTAYPQGQRWNDCRNEDRFLFITILGRSVQCCECCEQSVQSRCGPVQCCPDRHPAVTSMALWDTVQKYPACSAGTRFADDGWVWLNTNWQETILSRTPGSYNCLNPPTC